MRLFAAILALCAALPALGGCAAHRTGAAGQVGAVLGQPFADLNVVRKDIPALLLRVQASPFAKPADCSAIAREIADLTNVLGPVLSRTPHGAAGTGDDAETLAWNSARNAAGGLIPLRSVVRWLSGADRHDRQLQQAVLAGYVRRAYLEGLREACAPAAPTLAAAP